jgi:hypothetical protein
MANTRMFLKNTRTGTRIYLAKYYPSTGWYVPTAVDPTLAGDNSKEAQAKRIYAAAEWAQKVNEGFDQADFGHLTPEQREENRVAPGFSTPHKSPGGMHGEEWVLEYEH